MNSVKRHIYDVKNSQLEHDPPTSVNVKYDFAILRGFYFSQNFANAQFRENRALAKISEFTVNEFWKEVMYLTSKEASDKYFEHVFIKKMF